MAASRALARPITWYVAANAIAATIVLAFSREALDPARAGVLLTWLVASVAAEWFWLESITGEGSHSMASTFNFAAIFLLSPAESTWIIALAVGIGALLFQRRSWYRALFAAANVALVVFVSAHVYAALGGPDPSLAAIWSPASLVPFLATGVTFFLGNTFGVSLAIALSSEERVLAVWRRNFAYDFEMLGTVALFLISPILVLTYLAVGWPAFVLFALPLLVIRKGNRDYIDLQRTQASIVAAERLAAKGEMAAGIAHELNNYLAALRGGTQLMERQLRRADTGGIEKRLGLILEQVDNMTVLTRGLMDFAHREVTLAEVDLAELVSKTVTFLAPQPRFDGYEISLSELRTVVVEADAGQIQQVLVNLLHNAADALAESPGASPVIRVSLEQGKKNVQLRVRDEGCGMSEDVRGRIFEPTFTTKPEGHGFGLSTCQRIAASHGGKLEVESAKGKGTTMTLTIPLRAGSSGASRTVTRRAEGAPRERAGGTDRPSPRG